MLGRKKLVLISALAVIITNPATGAPVVITNSATDAPSNQRPIEDFLSTQGTLCLGFETCVGTPPDCFLFVPPVENFLGLNDPVRLLAASVDYAGVADQWISDETGGAVSFGTTFSGTITERSLNDGTGRVEVHVRLHTTNALSWAFACELTSMGLQCDFGGAPTIVGNRAPDVLAGAPMALGDSLLKLKYVAPGFDAPIPDLLQLLFCGVEGYEFPSRLQFVATASGTRNDDGSPAMVIVTQVGMFANPGQGAVADGFPVENVLIVP
jgi:hypothetical protein